MNEFHLEATGMHYIAGLVGNQLDPVRQAVLLQLQADQAACHRRDVNRSQNLLQRIGQRADVILMAVGNEKAPKLCGILDQISKIGDHQIHAVHVVLRKSDAAVHHDHVLAVLQDGDVLSNFIQPAQRNNFKFFCQKIYNSF